MSAAVASDYVRRMVELETRGSGDIEGAMHRLEVRYGLPFWPMVHLRRGAAKTVDADLFAMIKGAYLAYCEQQISALSHELAIEKATDDHADLADLEAEARRLAAKIAAARALLTDRRRR